MDTKQENLEQKNHIDVRSMELVELENFCIQQGWPKFRTDQIYQWIHSKLVRSPEEMLNLPKNIRAVLQEDWIGVEEETRYVSKLDGTNKFLFRLHDGNLIESVWMPYKHGNSVCISSQVGCRMGCRFCASTVDGMVRNLTASEMLDQVYAMQYLMGERISNVVIMGSGEPMDNYENLIRFLHILTDEKGLHISQRNVTVSSCGLVPEIRRFAKEGLSVTFALSLHATTDEERRELMPIARTYSIQEVLDACQYYFEQTGRRITYEYSLVRGVNDSQEHAIRLSRLLCGQKPCHVNLIPVNPIEERNFETTTEKIVQKFKYVLENNKINVTIRRGMGSDIDAACGQLRRKYIASQSGITQE
jgi:23S rRNA (adenine2503-C2)-methyltransferase